MYGRPNLASQYLLMTEMAKEQKMPPKNVVFKGSNMAFFSPTPTHILGRALSTLQLLLHPMPTNYPYYESVDSFCGLKPRIKKEAPHNLRWFVTPPPYHECEYHPT